MDTFIATGSYIEKDQKSFLMIKWVFTITLQLFWGLFDDRWKCQVKVGVMRGEAKINYYWGSLLEESIIGY